MTTAGDATRNISTSRMPRTGKVPSMAIGAANLFAMVLPDIPSSMALSQSLGSASCGDETGAFGVGEPMSSCAEEPIGSRKQNDANTLAYLFIRFLRSSLVAVPLLLDVRPFWMGAATECLRTRQT